MTRSKTRGNICLPARGNLWTKTRQPSRNWGRQRKKPRSVSTKKTSGASTTSSQLVSQPASSVIQWLTSLNLLDLLNLLSYSHDLRVLHRWRAHDDRRFRHGSLHR